ncbi:hypothetical protein A0U90_04815 [Kozakia baliensis]|nr:hypothetical protein A0U90_04815 [Kozakia baliensis]
MFYEKRYLNSFKKNMLGVDQNLTLIFKIHGHAGTDDGLYLPLPPFRMVRVNYNLSRFEKSLKRFVYHLTTGCPALSFNR